MLLIGTCAVLAGARSFAVAEYANDAGHAGLEALGSR
jgi:hypothetical protein